MIICYKYAVPKGYIGLTIFPFIFLKHKKFRKNNALINHERIHLKQQLELFILPFFIWYGIEFLIRLLYYKKWNMAYSNISFEREAYHNESNLNYLNEKGFWKFLKYLRNYDFQAK